MLQVGRYAGMCMDYWPALQLQAEIELEIGTRDSLLRALNYLQPYSECWQSLIDFNIGLIGSGREVLWYRPQTWVRMWRGEHEVCLYTYFHSPRPLGVLQVVSDGATYRKLYPCRLSKLKSQLVQLLHTGQL